MKIVIAGLGSIGRRHLRNLVSLGEKDILLLRTGHSTLPEAGLGDFPTVNSLPEAFDWQPEAFVISNPTALHLEVAIPAAEAGCHLLLEKPISHSLEGVEDLKSAVKNCGGKVVVGYQFRFHPGLQKVAGLLQEGVIGRPLSVRAQWSEWLPGWHPWEDYRLGYSARQELGGGVTLTLSHPLDYLRWLFGEVAFIWALAGKLNDFQIDVEDTVEVGLQFCNGSIGSLHLDYNGQPPTHHLEVIGTNGTLSWDNQTGDVLLYQAPRGGDHMAQIGLEPAWQTLAAPRNFDRNDLFLAEVKHFLEVTRGQTKPACSLDDGIMALKLALAVLRSAHEGQRMILE